ncbi:MAG TPA: hemerythrin domain-containing protein [Methylomirabilota bacterium]|nr:hemerythrin domain-containing protein [Methylomirabilota bacterium]
MSAVTSPTQTLREEHRVILRALVLVEAVADRPSGDVAIPTGWWEALLEWLRAFADRNHHAKEETYLFPALAQAGVPAAGGPVGVMLEEHAEGRALIRAMAESRGERRVEAARRYVHLLRDHIDKENAVLFPLAEAVLDAPGQAQLARAFEKVEAEQGSTASREHAEVLLDRLASALGDRA